MNERIRLLAEEAGLQPYYAAQEQHIQKFSELLIRECASVAGYYYTRNLCVSPTQIKEHFGVKNETQ